MNIEALKSRAPRKRELARGGLPALNGKGAYTVRYRFVKKYEQKTY